MAQIRKFTLQFTDNAVFYGGNVVYGELIIESRQVLLPRELFIECFGEMKLRKRTCCDKLFKCAIPTYDRKSVIKQRIDGAAHVARDSGISRIPFSFRLQPGSPQSLECGYLGHVRYWCQAKITIGRSRLFTWKPFTVLEELDLNSILDQNMRNLGCMLEEDVFTSCCLRPCGGSIKGEIKLNKKCFVAGENIMARFSVDNNSTVKIKSIYLLLTQTVSKPGTQNSKKLRLIEQRSVSPCCHRCISGHSLVVAKTDFRGLKSGEAMQMPQAKLHIPALPCSSKGGLGVSRSNLNLSNTSAPPSVSVSYSVVLMALMHPPPCARDFLLSIPIIVGSQPQLHDESLSGYSSSSLGPSFVESASTANIQHPSSLRSWSRNSTSEPVTQFAPLYPYYPTISLISSGDFQDASLRPARRRSILKKRRQEVASGVSYTSSGGEITDSGSVNYSWVSESSLAPKFETPV